MHPGGSVPSVASLSRKSVVSCGACIASSQCIQLLNCTQQVCHGTNRLCTQMLEILIDVCVTRSYHVQCFHCPNLGLMDKYAVLTSSALYSRFPPQQLPRIYTFILTTLSYAYLFSFTLICCILSECIPVQNNYVQRGLSS